MPLQQFRSPEMQANAAVAATTNYNARGVDCKIYQANVGERDFKLNNILRILQFVGRTGEGICKAGEKETYKL